jgi:hypothetical protein
MRTTSESPVVRFRDVGSVLSQVSADYYLSNRWTASVYLSSNLGPARSERGSFPQRVNSIFQLTLYL